MHSPGIATNPHAPTRILNARFAAMFVINTLAQYAVYSMNTLTAPFAASFGAAPTVIGLVSSTFAVTAMAFKLVSSPAIDAFDRKKVLLFALSVLLAACLCDAFATSVPFLVASRLFSGTALAFLPTVCFVIVSDNLPADKMGTGMGYYTLSTVVVQASAPAVGLWISNRLGFNLTFVVVSAVVAVTILFTLAVPLERPRERRPFTFRPGSIFSAAVLAPTFILLIEAMIWSQVNTFLVLFAQSRGVLKDQIGLFFTVLALVLVISRPTIGTLADRIGSSRVLFASMFFLAAAFLTISWSHELNGFLLGAALAAFGYAGCQPTLMAICLRLVPAERRGAASCTAYLGQDIGNLIGGVLGGALVQHFGYAAMWQIMLVPLIIAAIVTIVYRRRIDFIPAETAATAA
ncbi:MFS transporter [Novosphingobium flavum]|uniref:MFS transporter n=1 Tax=Novosphingobium flavum TaxID=1778672 RepID=A0A7X1FQ47_9SPHN|nr:MFS transporter [Novosphingobium flavum]MBC2664925.1 MFS transporter [Novosphingobium flavum]